MVKKTLAVIAILIILIALVRVVEPLNTVSYTGGTLSYNPTTQETVYYYNPDLGETVNIKVHSLFVHIIPHSYLDTQKNSFIIQKKINGVWSNIYSTGIATQSAHLYDFYINTDYTYTWNCTEKNSYGEYIFAEEGYYRAVTYTYGEQDIHYFAITRDIHYEPWSANHFRYDCLDEDGIKCAKDLIHNKWLVTHKLSYIWWDLTQIEREQTANWLIDNYLFFNINYRTTGYSQCQGPTGFWENNYCSANAVIRYIMFSNGNDYYEDIHNYYWSLDKENYTCYYQYSFNLPVYIVTAASITWMHALTAFQVGIHKGQWDSWIFFQYNEKDIRPGDWQLPFDPDETGRGLRVAIGRPREDLGIIEGHGYVNSELVQFMIQPDGSIVNIAP